MQNNPFDQIPDVDFVPTSVDTLLEEMIADYENAYYAQTGEEKSIPISSPERIQIYTEAARFHMAYRLIDRGCKMNLLKYSEGGYLDNLAALFGLERLSAQPSVSRVRFTLSAPQDKPVLIPKGTRVSTPDKLFFETDTELIIMPGDSTGEVNIKSQSVGAATAGTLPGQIRILVDPIAYVTKVENIFSTQGGVDTEDDESLRVKIFYYRNSYSVAGPRSAYRYFVKSYSQAIEGISVHSPEPGHVDIRITLKGGVLPEAPFIQGLFAYLEDKRPQTDLLYIGPPDTVEYDLLCTWYIAKSSGQQQEEITNRVSIAVQAYLDWQDSEIGRDIVPDALIKAVMSAGAKRVPVHQPVFTTVDYKSICRHRDIKVLFGGVEDD